MSEVKRYWVPNGALDGEGWHQDDNEVVLAGEHDVAVDALKYKAELYDEVWQKATGMGYMNVTMALEAVATLREELAVANHEIESRISAEVGAIEALQAAEQRNADLVELLRNPSDEMIEAGNGAAVVEMEHDSDLGSCGWISNADEVLTEMLKAALKPTESGASE